jgi:hypothetical protein
MQKKRPPPKDRSSASSTVTMKGVSRSLHNASAGGKRNNEGLSDINANDADVVNTDSEYEFEFDPNENIDEMQKQTMNLLPTHGHRKKRKGLSDNDDDFDPNEKKKAPLSTCGHRKKGLSNDSDTNDDFDQNQERGMRGKRRRRQSWQTMELSPASRARVLKKWRRDQKKYTDGLAREEFKRR